jgi:PleD family two-component response regulator
MLVENSGLNHEQGFIRATITMGAVLAHRGEEGTALIKRADALLYQGKAAGRNRVVIEA